MTEYESFADDLNARPPKAAGQKRKRPRSMPPTGRKKRKSGGLLAAVAWLVGLFTAGVLCWTVVIVVNPHSPFNPFAVAEEPTATLYVIPSATPTPPTLPPTWTASPIGTQGPTLTPLVLPTATATFETTLEFSVETPQQFEPTATLSLSPFALDGAIDLRANGNGEGCSWMSIQGRVLDLDGRPKRGIAIQVTGENFEQIVWSGDYPTLGASGYEVLLNLSPYVATWRVRLLSRNAIPLSTVVNVRTSADCKKNVAVVNFVQNHEMP